MSFQAVTELSELLDSVLHTVRELEEEECSRVDSARRTLACLAEFGGVARRDSLEADDSVFSNDSAGDNGVCGVSGCCGCDFGEKGGFLLFGVRVVATWLAEFDRNSDAPG